MNDAQTWTAIIGMLAVIVALLGLVSKLVHNDLAFAVETLSARIDAQGHQLAGKIDAQGHQIRTEMNERFAQVDARFDSLDRRIDGIDADVQVLTRRFLGGGGAA